MVPTSSSSDLFRERPEGRSSDSRAGSSAAHSSEGDSEAGHAELVTALARVHDAQVLPPGLRELADEFAYRALGLLFPHFSTQAYGGSSGVADELSALRGMLERAVGDVALVTGEGGAARPVVAHLYSRLEALRDALLLDAVAIYEGDPAAQSVDEVILAYPGFLATACYRIAHELHGLLPLFPRLLTEVAHRATGIDIHPAAQIGPSFAIDHGTGIVIGETAVLGTGVRLYQGVTLGAARVNKRLEHMKRHPTLGDDVVVYANATILGGETIIGRGSRIGGNVWLTRSVPPYSVVTPTARVERREGSPDVTDDLIEFNI